MTFERQVWWSWVGGISFAALALALKGIVALSGDRWAALLDLATAALVLAAVFGIIGGMVRPIQRWYWLRIWQPSTLSDRYKRLSRAGRIGEWWLHLDAAGRDRDGANG